MKFAQFLDKTLCVESAEPDYSAQTLNKYPSIVEHFGNSLRLGCEFIYQSLSRMLNVWLDFANALAEDRRHASNRRARPGAADVSARSAADVSASFSQRAHILAKMTDKVAAFVDQLPTYYFLTAFPLIMSRFTHPAIECFNLLEKMVVHCALNFPHQTLWQFASLYRVDRREGANAVPHDRARKVLSNPNLAGLQSIINKYVDLFQEFSRLCKAPKACGVNPGRHPMTSMISHSSALLKDRAFDDILIPAQKFLTIVLPRQVGSNPAYNPFPERMVFIGRIERHAHVYSSMQKPVRVGLVGTDGVVYPMIFKAMDDMRIDSRAMAFNSVVNMYLKRDAEGRDRGLHIRTYTVLPLADRCGVIEFIPRLETMRAVTQNMRRSRGYNETKVKQLIGMERKKDEDKRKYVIKNIQKSIFRKAISRISISQILIS